MSSEKKDSIDNFFDKVDAFTDKYVDRMSQVSTPEKEDRFQREQRSAEVPPPSRQLANPDIVIVDPDDAQTILKALDEAAGMWKQRASSDALPERSRALARANSVASESIAEELRAKLSQGFHLILKR